MKAKILTQIRDKVEAKVRQVVHETAPIAKKEISKAVSQSVSQKKDMIFAVGGTLLIGCILLYNGKPGSSSILPSIAEEAARNINITYNEVHITNNYLKGENV